MINDANAPKTEDHPRLQRVHQGRLLGGVAAGLAEYLDIDVAVVRIGLVALAFCGGLAVPLYAAGWLFMPEEGSDTSLADDLLRHAPIG